MTILKETVDQWNEQIEIFQDEEFTKWKDEAMDDDDTNR